MFNLFLTRENLKSTSLTHRQTVYADVFYFVPWGKKKLIAPEVEDFYVQPSQALRILTACSAFPIAQTKKTKNSVLRWIILFEEAANSIANALFSGFNSHIPSLSLRFLLSVEPVLVRLSHSTQWFIETSVLLQCYTSSLTINIEASFHKGLMRRLGLKSKPLIFHFCAQ
jgi:hypothetical protein